MTAPEEAWTDEPLVMVLTVVTLLVASYRVAEATMSDEVRSHRLGPPLLAALLAAGPVQAQIVTDGTVGPKVSLRGGEIEIGANLGTWRGDNLFHSFEKFGIAPGQTATFTEPGTIKTALLPPAAPLAEGPAITLLGDGGDAWTFEKRVEGALPNGGC